MSSPVRHDFQPWPQINPSMKPMHNSASDCACNAMRSAAITCSACRQAASRRAPSSRASPSAALAVAVNKPQAAVQSHTGQRNPINLDRFTARPGKSQRINRRWVKTWKLVHVPCNTPRHRSYFREYGMSLLDAFLASGVVVLIVLIVLKKKAR